MNNQVFSPAAYKTVLCEYLQALGDDLLNDAGYMNNKRGEFVLNIRSRLMRNVKLTKKQNKILMLIENELAKQLKGEIILEQKDVLNE